MRCKEGAHGGEGCGIQQCKVVNLGSTKPKLLIGVDGYSLLPYRCILTICPQFNGQIPSSRFARAFFLLQGCEISPKNHNDHHNITSFKKVLQI